MSTPIKHETIVVTPFAQNCTLSWDTTTYEGLVIDPGGDIERIEACIDKEKVRVQTILLTHGHLDHVGGAQELAQHLQVPIWGPHKEDAFLLENLPLQFHVHGLESRPAFTPTRWLQDGDTIPCGSWKLEVLHCPGHTPGHVAFFQREERIIFVGDIIFKGSIGRTDFPGGDQTMLIDSVCNKLWPLGDDIVFWPGHYEPSTFGQERRNNPYVADTVLQKGTHTP